MAEPNDNGTGTEPQDTDPQGKGGEPNEPQGGSGTGTEPGGDGGDGGILDSHGQRGIAVGKYQRDIKAKDDEIAALKAQLEAAGKAGDDGQKAMAEVEKLKQQLADERLDGSLAKEGCVDTKAARARLDDFGGDVAKLKESCPYLFRQAGTSGVSPAGSGDITAEQRKARARAAAGLK